MKRASGYLATLCAVLGLSLFLGLLARVGVNTILDKIRLLGLGFLVLLLFSGARYTLRTISWRLCLKTKRSISLLGQLRIMLVGEAFNDMSPAGPMLGDTVRVYVASKHMSADESATSVTAERLIYSFSVVLFLLAGVVMLLLK
ncbi:MAG TPA: lysylphosphatidylglycerol synthase domain-containing protein, partial [Spirochaetia bacterium]|nr:lysylphosphatidylglycerol synthase domain-containing protein [Spirochaetia bacterium]